MLLHTHITMFQESGKWTFFAESASVSEPQPIKSRGSATMLNTCIRCAIRLAVHVARVAVVLRYWRVTIAFEV